jgi:hypothetical protein
MALEKTAASAMLEADLIWPLKSPKAEHPKR